jgi:CRISPR-associated endonuclease Cas1
MAASHTLPHPSAFRKSGVLVLNGYGIRVQVNAGHLLLHDGVADERRTIRLPRVNHGLKRLVIIGNDGFITLEAIRWISDVGAAFVMLDRRGKVLAVTGPVSPSDAKLRRAQGLALGNGIALKISKELISQKLAGQELLVRDMLRSSPAGDAIARFRDELTSADGLDQVRLIESQAARCYWQSWSLVPICWPRKDEVRVPEHWKRFGSRISTLTHSPRLASTPPNALLNFLYSLLESESRLSAAAMGLDPGLGFLHMDTANRDSLACDIMEPIRPRCDAFVLNWLQTESLRRSDFWEDRNGNCRIGSPLAIKLCETSGTWRRLVAPVAEQVAQEVWSSVSKPTSTSKLAEQLIATRLTQSRRRAVKGSDVPAVKALKPEKICPGCGATRREGKHCPSCGREVSREELIESAKVGRLVAQSPKSQEKRSETQRRHRAAQRAWRSSPKPAWLTEETYTEKIQPSLAGVTISALSSTLGVSQPYAADVRAGRRSPHPRHWQALAGLVGISNPDDAMKMEVAD